MSGGWRLLEMATKRQRSKRGSISLAKFKVLETVLVPPPQLHATGH